MSFFHLLFSFLFFFEKIEGMRWNLSVSVVLLCVSGVALGYFADQFVTVPQPKEIKSVGALESARAVELDAKSLTIVDSAKVCDADCVAIVKNAFNRSVLQAMEAQRGLAPWKLSPHPEFSMAPVGKASLAEKLTAVSVAFTGKSAAVPALDAKSTAAEYYELAVDATGAAKINAHTVWGVLHALETLCQVVEWNGKDFVVQRVPFAVADEPRFAWRGFMVDVSRHYMPVRKLENLVDTLASFKMNVLHMHLSDAQSFPLEIPELPAFANAAFSRRAVYRTGDIANLTEYARQRGVLLVPEIDIPAHTASWRFANEDVTANCFEYLASRPGSYEENLVALNPASGETWKTITTVLDRVGATFAASPYTHVGGDEVSATCWQRCTQKDAILAYMSEHGIASYADLEATFDRYTQKTVATAGKVPVVWEDVMMKDAALPGSIVHIWRNTDRLVQAVRAGHYAIQSYGYYLDRQSPLCSGECSGINWMFSWTYRDIYRTDPTKGLGLSAEEEARVLGGEAALWAESIDAPNFDAMGISRLGAFAERLWSPASVTDPKALEIRTQRHRCLNAKRGIAPGAGPLSSDFCETSRFFQ